MCDDWPMPRSPTLTPLRTLWTGNQGKALPLSASLARLYGSFRLPQADSLPYIFSNFVTTLQQSRLTERRRCRRICRSHPLRHLIFEALPRLESRRSFPAAKLLLPQDLRAADRLITDIYIRIREPGVQRAARTSCVWAVIYAMKCASRLTR